MSGKKSKDLLIGAVVGTVLGAVTALLLAPKSGRELRADLSEGYQQVSERTQQFAGEVADKSKQIVSTVAEKTQSAAETIGRHTSELAGKARETAVQVGQEVKSWTIIKGAARDEVASAEASVAATTAECEEQ